MKSLRASSTHPVWGGQELQKLDVKLKPYYYVTSVLFSANHFSVLSSSVLITIISYLMSNAKLFAFYEGHPRVPLYTPKVRSLCGVKPWTMFAKVTLSVSFMTCQISGREGGQIYVI